MLKMAEEPCFLTLEALTLKGATTPCPVWKTVADFEAAPLQGAEIALSLDTRGALRDPGLWSETASR
jgi:hypothetical protein